MEDTFDIALSPSARQGAMETLRACNALTVRYGLTLTDDQLHALLIKREEALAAAGRVEFGGGILRDLIAAFCDSPFIVRENYEETLHELVESFYYFKNESEDRFSDDELIAIMRRHYDTVCQGSMEYMTGTTLAELCRGARLGDEIDGADDFGRLN